MIYKVKTHIKIKIILLILINAINVVAFNPRVTCDSNKMLFGSRYGTFQLFLLRDPTISSYYSILAQDQDCGSGNGRTITSNITAIPLNNSKMTLSSCKNILINGQSCCPNQSFSSYSSNLNSLYNIIFNNTQYPIVKYFNNLIANLGSNNCLYERSFLPSSDTTFAMLMNNYSTLIKKIEINQRKFINQTLCLVCLSTKDYTNFIYPNISIPGMPILNNIIYQRSYFINRTNQLTQILMQLQSLHNSMNTYILRLMSTMYTTTTNCQNIKSQALNSTFILNKKICLNEISCKKIVVQYFGQIATPQLLYYINRMSNGLSMLGGGGKYVISQNINYGFKGNVSYLSMYGNRYLPNVTIYTPQNQYSGLY